MKYYVPNIVSLLHRILPIISIIQLFLCFIFHGYRWADELLINILLFWFLLTIYAYRLKQNGAILLGFLATFFVFILSREFILNLLEFDFDIISSVSIETKCLSYVIIFLSLFCIYWGHRLFTVKVKSIKFEESSETMHLLKKQTKLFFYYTLPFKVLKVFVGVYNTMKYGYVMEGDGGVLSSSAIIDKLAQVNLIVFCGYLMLAPSKKELLPVLKIAIAVYVFSIFEGTRGYLMYFILFIIVYLYSRDNYLKASKCMINNSALFLTSRVKKYVVILSIPLLIFLNLFTFIRSKNDVVSRGVVYDLVGFFVQQGFSYGLIPNVIDNKESLPKGNTSYTFGPVINMIKYSKVCQVIGIGEKEPTFEEIPLKGNNLGATITWLSEPNYYMMGGGYGTQYIAELYADFGLIGVVVGSFFLGVIISKMTFFYYKNWIARSMLCSVIVTVLSMPRDFFLSWFVALISIPNILVLWFIYKNALSKTNSMNVSSEIISAK